MAKRRLKKGECWIHESEFVTIDMSDCGGYELGLRESQLGCKHCQDEKPFADGTNKGVSFIIRGNIQFILEDVKEESGMPWCKTIASFVINRCPMCGKKLEADNG